MRSRFILAILAPAFALAWLAACGGGGGISAVDDGAALSSDAALGDAGTGDGGADSTAVDIYDLPGLLDAWKEPAAGDGEWSEENRFRYGGAYEHDLPRHYAYTSYPYHEMEYRPVDEPNGSAYAFYQFPLAGYAGSPVIHLDWEILESSEVETELWLGLANLDEMCWDWLTGGLGDAIDPGSLDPYLSEDGNLRMAVLLFGEGEYQLNWLRIGGNIAPFVELLTDPIEGPAGDFLIDARSCHDLDGELETYLFDLDGDGSYETDRGGTNFAWPVYDSPGTHSIGVKIIDDSGSEATGEIAVTVNSWTKTTLFPASVDEMSLTQDEGGDCHIVYYGGDAPEFSNRWICYASNNTGSWISEDVAVIFCASPADLQIEVMTDGSILVSYVEWSEGPERYIRFHQRGPEGWYPRSDLDFVETETDINMYDLALDSQDNPHVVFGNSGWGEHSGSYEYRFYDGSAWDIELSRVPAVDVAIQVDPADSPMILMDTYAINTLFACRKSGDGYLFEVLEYNSGFWKFEMDSTGIPGYTCVVDQPPGDCDDDYHLLLHYQYEWGSQYTLWPDDGITTDITEHDFAFSPGDVPHALFSIVLDLPDRGPTGVNAYASAANNWEMEPYNVEGICYIKDYPHLAIDTEENPMIFAVRKFGDYRDAEHTSGYDIALYTR